jgi:hypothetical protein
MQFNLVRRDGDANITVYVDGELFVADDKHPLFDAIVTAAVNGNEDIAELFNAGKAVAAHFEPLSERVAVKGDEILVDGDPITDVIVDHILTALSEGSDFGSLVAFLEKVYTNNSEHTRENLFRWLNATGGFTIDDEGDIIGYKGLTEQGGSVHHGPATVDGVDVNGSVPNKPGSVVEMQRSAVEHNPARACASGLHVGTWEYASSFGNGVTAVVKVNPRDVVSVPTDCNGQKMRVSRYKVVEYVDEAHNTAVVPNGFVPSEDYVDGYEDGWEDGYDGLDPRF